MTTQDTIQIRIDKKTKQAAKKTLDQMGLDMSSAIKMFLVNVVNSQSIPLDIKTPNGFTIAQEKILLAETVEAKRTGKRYDNLDELFSDLDL